jgi:hypothetical protein
MKGINYGRVISVYQSQDMYYNTYSVAGSSSKSKVKN